MSGISYGREKSEQKITFWDLKIKTDKKEGEMKNGKTHYFMEIKGRIFQRADR